MEVAPLLDPAATEDPLSVIENYALARRDRALWLIEPHANAIGLAGWVEGGRRGHVLVADPDVGSLGRVQAGNGDPIHVARDQ